MSFYLKTLSLLFGSLSSVNLLRMLSLLCSSCYGMRSWVFGQFSLCIMCQLWLQDLNSSPACILVRGCCMIPKTEFGSLPTLLQKAVIIRDNNVDFRYKKKLVISSLLQNTFWTKEHVHVSKSFPITVCQLFLPKWDVFLIICVVQLNYFLVPSLALSPLQP